MSLDNHEIYAKSMESLQAGNLDAAGRGFSRLAKVPAFMPYAHYRLADIANRNGDPLAAKDLYYKAFRQKPDICESILNEGHPNRNYVFKGMKDEEELAGCPLCGKAGYAYWCYNMLELGAAYAQQYNPIRVWMRCDECCHLYAQEFPWQEAVNAAANLSAAPAMQTNTAYFPYYSEIFSRLGNIVQGDEVLEIGIGGCEAGLVAQEFGYSVLGLDISGGNVQQARKYGIPAEIMDMMEFTTDKKWDLIIMGDVIEHVSDPVAAMAKMADLLKEGGAIWLSTPNFEASFAKVAGHNDAMRRVANHKSYFSRFSFFKLLQMNGLMPVDYRISAHYNGSMEVIAVKSQE